MCPRFGAGSVDGCPPTGALVSSRRSGWLVRHSGPACAGRRSACLNRPSVDPSSTKPATDEPSLPPRSRRAGRPARRRRTGSSGRPPSGDCEGVSERPSRLRHVTETHAGCGSRIVRVGSTTDQPVLVLGEDCRRWNVPGLRPRRSSRHFSRATRGCWTSARRRTARPCVKDGRPLEEVCGELLGERSADEFWSSRRSRSGWPPGGCGCCSLPTGFRWSCGRSSSSSTGRCGRRMCTRSS